MNHPDSRCASRRLSHSTLSGLTGRTVQLSSCSLAGSHSGIARDGKELSPLRRAGGTILSKGISPRKQ
jgi:hypothetical protein